MGGREAGWRPGCSLPAKLYAVPQDWRATYAAASPQALLSPPPITHTITTMPCTQVFTGCVNSFAHGSNDVANAIGPYAAIYSV